MILRLVLVALIFYALPVSAANLLITEAWIKNLPAVVPVRAGYMSIANGQANSVTIKRLTSESFGRIEIHRSIEKDGVVSMQPIHALTIGPDESFRLAPGGYHLMMMNPVKTLVPGNKVIVTIGFDDQSTQNIEMIVRK